MQKAQVINGLGFFVGSPECRNVRWLPRAVAETSQDIEAPELLELELLAIFPRVTPRGAFETAHRLKDGCGQVFRYDIAMGDCTRNRAADLRDGLPPVLARHLAAIVDPKRAAELLRAMGDYAGHPVTRAALWLSALLFLQPDELRQPEWAWVDLDAATVTVPFALIKRRRDEKANRAPHLVPLALPAVRSPPRAAPVDGPRPVRLPVDADQRPADVRKHDEHGAAPDGFRPRDGDRARLLGDGPQRTANHQSSISDKRLTIFVGS